MIIDMFWGYREVFWARVDVISTRELVLCLLAAESFSIRLIFGLGYRLLIC